MGLFSSILPIQNVLRCYPLNVPSALKFINSCDFLRFAGRATCKISRMLRRIHRVVILIVSYGHSTYNTYLETTLPSRFTIVYNFFHSDELSPPIFFSFIPSLPFPLSLSFPLENAQRTQHRLRETGAGYGTRPRISLCGIKTGSPVRLGYFYFSLFRRTFLLL